MVQKEISRPINKQQKNIRNNIENTFRPVDGFDLFVTKRGQLPSNSRKRGLPHSMATKVNHTGYNQHKN